MAAASSVLTSNKFRMNFDEIRIVLFVHQEILLSIEDIRRSAASGNLIVILGAGATIALMSKSRQGLSWDKLVKSGLDHVQSLGFINESQHTRHSSALLSDDIDDLLGVAEFVARKLGAPRGDLYARWMRNTFEAWIPEQGGMQNAIRSISKQNIPIATLNFDTMAESCTELPSIDLSNVEAVMAWIRKERDGVLHLHGVWNQPATCVFGIRDYHSALSDEYRQLAQRSLSTLNRILFVGCGDTFIDPNFSSLITWLRANVGAGTPQHYALVRSDELKRRRADPCWHGFVEPLSYGDNYTDLPGFLLGCFPTVQPRKPVSKVKEAAEKEAQTIEAYKTFLLKDCGEMTIEGMRADMDTAQRKFDLEKLFVPLEVSSYPPQIPPTDPDREVKLQQWHEKHAKPIAFASAFQKSKRIALLALPGGGKTLLLKRLAVAYSQSDRLESGSDNLPKVDLIPVMIRCREWKDHIRKPISALLNDIAIITGEPHLEGLGKALARPLKAGSVLLLVDGLDEIHNDAAREIFVENLEKFLEANPKIRMLVTSREAGFDLVAPCLARFCEKFKIAPLNRSAILTLCEHWHRLMSGGAREALSESAVVSSAILESAALRRLAENPLLLTMLLVVKHGAGRLPPDRVSLYDRAVEVLLDTWNIKGHAALNVKEAVPQLACLAYELLLQGKQTATEREILRILEDAREKLPMIGRYAKDSPHEFLKRVELRSSLLLEGGHTKENGRAVPFYQFRHLTFQEYLAAVASVEGYLLSKEGTLPTAALAENLVSEEWKEVIPMAAVLARTQAGPLLDALIAVAEQEQRAFLHDKDGRNLWRHRDNRLPAATGRLAQAMAEEAVFPPKLVASAVQCITLFAHGCQGNENWQVLSRGPYGPDLRDAALKQYLYNDFGFSTRVLARNTSALLEAHAESSDFWIGPESERLLLQRLEQTGTESLVRSILSIAGGFWLHRGASFVARSQAIYSVVEATLRDTREHVLDAAAWTWSFWRHLQSERGDEKPIPDSSTISLLISLFLSKGISERSLARYVVGDLIGVPRNGISVELSAEQSATLHEWFCQDFDKDDSFVRNSSKIATARVAFMLDGLYSDQQIRDFISRTKFSRFEKNDAADIYKALGIPFTPDRERPPKRTRKSEG